MKIRQTTIALAILALTAVTAPAAVTGFTLVNANTDSDISPINDGDTIDLATLPSQNLNIRANVDTAPASVTITLTGATTESVTEGVAPYALWGDSSGDYKVGTLNVGSHTLSATPEGGSAYTVNFTVTSSVSPPPSGGLNIPNGRFAFSHDGNQHDADDWGALPMVGALAWASGTSDRVVHIDHSNHLGDNSTSRENEMVTSANGIISRFDINPSIVFNDQQELAAAIANFKAEAEKSSASDPLWFMCAGPMEVPWRCLNAVSPEYLQYIHCVSHSSWNENHDDTSEMSHTWSSMKSDFPAVTFHDIADQNSSDGDNDWNTPLDKWYWLRDGTYEPYRWVYDRNYFTDKYDPSDAGMFYWVLSGATSGGDDHAGWPEAQALLEGALQPADGTYLEAGGLVVMEMENTSSDLGLWEQKSSVGGFTGTSHLEFTGNGIDGGDPDSPLTYTFKITTPGTYSILLRAHKRLDGAEGDKCNDCYVRMEGDFTSGNPSATLNALQTDTKLYGGTDSGWGWATELDSAEADHTPARYVFKAGETYTLTISGRSIRFNLDRIVFRHSTVSEATAQDPSLPESERASGTTQIIYNARTDFPFIDTGEVPYYEDATRDALAIDASVESYRGKFARAVRSFDGPSGSYDATITTLTELDGECAYRLLVNGSVVGTYTNPPTTTDYALSTHTWTDVDIDQGDTVAVESDTRTNGNIPENGGTAWARGRWRQLELTSETTGPYLSVPTGLAASVGDGSVTLNWNDITDDSLAGYNVYRSTTSYDFSSALVTNLSSSDYVDNTVANGTTYYYAVSATYTNGTESGISAQVSAMPHPVFAIPFAVDFGSDHDGLGGFIQSATVPLNEFWTTDAASVRYRNQDAGVQNASLLAGFALDITPGNSYTIEGTVLMADGYADDNNRVGMYLFGDSAQIPNEDEIGALGIIFNTDDGSAGGAPGNNAKDYLSLIVGIDNTVLDGPVSRTQTVTPFAQDLFSNEVTFKAELVYTNVSGTGSIQVTATMTTFDDEVTTVGPITVPAADYTGNYFGFVTRARARNYATNPTSYTGRGLPWVMEYKSFSITDNNAAESGYDQWVEKHGGTHLMGKATDDADSDGVNNLYEYGMGGNPTNAAMKGTLPRFSKSGNRFIYVHPKRSDDTTIIYQVETTTNLVSGTWINTGSIAIGTNITGETLDFVTNEVDTTENEKYIRLKIEQ